MILFRFLYLPQITTLSPRSHPRHLVEKLTAQKDIIIETTSDSQVNSKFSHRWSPASPTFNNYFYLFLDLYITRITINNNTPHLKSPKNQNRRIVLGRPAKKYTGGGGGGFALTSLRSTNPRPYFCLGSSDKTITTKVLAYSSQPYDNLNVLQIKIKVSMRIGQSDQSLSDRVNIAHA